jgi:methionyl-tRNA formyltransferase
MRILFAGTPSLAVPALEKISRAHQVIGVLTSPDKPAGRGRVSESSPVKRAALMLGLPVMQPARLDEAFRDQARAASPQVLVVAAFGRIFRQEFLDLFPMGGINLHPSLLPRFRGPSPISAAILAGDGETGVSIQKIALKLDTGDILAQERFPLDGSETTATLTEALAEEGANLLAGVLAAIEKGTPPAPVVQNEAGATYCRTLRKADGAILWDEPAIVIDRKIRAFDPWPRAATIVSGEALLLLKSHVYPGTLGSEASRAAPGTVLSLEKGHGILVRTGEGILAVERLQKQFKKPMDWRSFLNGNPEIIGTRLGT